MNKNQQGVRYIGDGSWGVPEGRCGQRRITKRPEYFEYFDTEEPNHIWLITLNKTTDSTHTLIYRAVDLEGNIVFNTTDDLSLK